MKPASIKKFDLLYLGSIALSIVSFALGYGMLTEQMQAELAASGVDGSAIGGGVLIGSIIFGVAISAALWFLVSILRIEFVKWILILFVIIGLIGVPALFADGLQFMDIISLVGFALSIGAVYFLFQPDAKAWFAEKRRGADPQ